MTSLTEVTAALVSTMQALVAANERIAVLEKELRTMEATLSKETVRAGILDRDLRLVTYKHGAYIRHFGSCPQHPNT